MSTFVKLSTVILCLALANCDGKVYKRDILGVSTGMTVTDATKVLQAKGIHCDPQISSSTYQMCNLSGSNKSFISFSTNSKYSDKISIIAYSTGNQFDDTTIAYIVRTYSLISIDSGIYAGWYQMPTGEYMQIDNGGITIRDDSLANYESANPSSSYVPPKL